MKMKNYGLIVLTAAILCGCNNSSAGDSATPQDKKNLDDLIQNGVGPHNSSPTSTAPKPEGGAAAPPMGVGANGKVDPP